MIFRGKNKAENMTHSASEDGFVVPRSLVSDYLREQRRKRRWNTFFKLIFVAYIGVGIYMFMSDKPLETIGSHTAVVEISGLIGAENISASKVKVSLQSAFSNENSRGVVIEINSPGGTPVQAAQINQEIIRLKKRYPEKPVYAAIADIGTSGAYYIAVAADKIYAHPASIVGSIGVIMQGFGFEQAMQKLGIQRRVIVAGENKDLLDPFATEDPRQVAHLQNMLDEVHKQFISAVKQGRGDRLQSNPDVFSGLVWSGESAKKLGLIDEFASSDQIARDVIGAKKMIDYTQRSSFYDLFSDQLGVVISRTLLNLKPSVTLQ